MRKKVKIKTNYNGLTIIMVIITAILGFIVFGILGALISGGIVGACWHGINKMDIKDNSDKTLLPEKEDELYKLAKQKESSQKEITIKTFVKKENGDWYERKSIYKH